MSNFIMTYPIFTIAVLGSFLGTVIAYAAPYFTNDYLCAGRGFKLGNLGLYVFIHNGWAHYVGNMLVFIPGYLIIGSLCKKTGCPVAAIVAISILTSIVSAIPVMFTRHVLCGLSGIAFMLLEMGLVWNGMNSSHKIAWFVVAGASLLICIYSDKGTKGNYKLGHVLSMVSGALFGIIFGTIF